MAAYHDLIMRCPACIENNQSTGPARQWYHAKEGCNGKIQIGDDANFKCTRCNESFHIRDARYACEAHQSDYRPTTSAHFASAISTAGQVTSIAGKQWLMRLLENMGDFG